MARIDFNTIEDLASTPLAPGIYDFVVDNTNYRDSSNGNPMVEVTLKVNAGDCAGRKVFDTFVISNKFALSRLKQFAQSMGLQYLDLPDNTGSKDYPAPVESIHGMEVRAVIQMDPKDAERVRVKAYKPVSGSPAAGAIPMGNNGSAKAALDTMGEVPF